MRMKKVFLYHLHLAGCFPFVRTDWPDHSCHSISLLIKTIQKKKLLEKAYFIFKLTGQAMVWLTSSDKWKAPLVSL